MSILNRTIAPPFQTISKIAFPWPVPVETKREQLPPIFELKALNMPAIQLKFVMRSGSYNEFKPGLAYLTTQLLAAGTKNRTAQFLADQLDYHGAKLSIKVRADNSTLSLMFLPKYFKQLLSLSMEMLFASTMPEEQIDLYKKIKIQAIKLEEAHNAQIAFKRFKAALFGEQHPYGYSLTEKNIQAVNRQDILSYYNDALLSAYTVCITGPTAKMHIEALENALAIHYPSTSVPLHAATELTLPSKQVAQKINLPKENSLQTAICIGKILFPKTHPDYFALYITTALLGGYFGSRLMCNIREEKGYTYGIHAQIVTLRNTSYLLISTEAIKTFARQTCEEIYKEIMILQEHEVKWKELNTLKNYLAGNFLTKIDTPFSIVKSFQEAYLQGLDQKFYFDFYDTLQKITPTEIKEMANKYLQIDTLTEIKVG